MHVVGLLKVIESDLAWRSRGGLNDGLELEQNMRSSNLAYLSRWQKS